MKWSLKISRLALALSLLLALAPQAAHAQAASVQYVVQAGDTLYSIAYQFGTTVEAVEAANPDVAPAFLSIGQALAVPGFDGLAGTLSVHNMELGESWDSLALRFGLKRETLLRLNRVVNPDLLSLDEGVVLLDSADAGAAVPTGVAYPAWAGMLALAASSGENPWALAAANHLPHPGLVPPHQSVVVPGGDQPPNGLPAPLRALQVGPLPLEQGHTVSVHVVSSEPLPLAGAFGAWPLQFNQDAETSQYALLGIYRLADEELYRLAITAQTPSGDTIGYAQLLPVNKGSYLVGLPLTVDPKTLDPAVTEPELEQIKQIVAPDTPQRYWDGVFALPSVGRITSPFGLLRSYNNGPYDSFHTGVDFSGGDDRPITAPAPGRVVFAGELTVRGNATLIDHGWGVYTGYWHQSKIEVNVGDVVATGQVIGYNGSTGRVTGPHLHWELWVGGIQVDPLQWTETVFP